MFEDINAKKGSNSFLALENHVQWFPFQWHYHPEYELTHIRKGSGKRMVGDSYEYFCSGDLVLIGPNLPHTWVSDKEPGARSSAVVIQFSETFIESFFQHSECAAIRKLLSQSGQGLYFTLRPGAAILSAIDRLPDYKGMDRITGLLQILNSLAGKKAVPLASPYFQPTLGKKSESRINKICQYIHRHSSEAIPLKKIADLVHLSESAFCKFFKRTTGKTYSDYLNEIRIGHSCHLLMESDDTIAEIAYESGFESLTYFNRVFLRKKGVRPGDFRRRGGTGRLT
jgi:AraC-like DNA-binding protein